MRDLRKTRAIRCAATLLLAGAVTAATGCGGEDFANNPRPAAAIELTGVIRDKEVTISPAKVGAGPVVITIANETNAAHTITLEGETIREQVGPVNPQGTGTIQKTLQPGSYKVKAGSTRAVPREIKAAQLTIGKKRGSSSNEVLQP
jgi:hypothetical protein